MRAASKLNPPRFVLADFIFQSKSQPYVVESFQQTFAAMRLDVESKLRALPVAYGLFFEINRQVGYQRGSCGRRVAGRGPRSERRVTGIR